jgi:hypothetical protein
MSQPNFSPRLGGRMGLDEKRRRLLRFHWVEMEVMEILASWSETMVYLPVRAGVGRHIWEQALHADRLGWALRNLRQLGRVVAARAPSDEFVRYCEQLHATEQPAHRLVGLYRVLLPALAAAERAYLEATDPLADGNAVEALDLCLHDHARQQLWAEQVLATLLRGRGEAGRAAEFEHAQRLLLLAAGGVDADGPPAYFLPYHGWPENDEARAARSELPTAPGQWQTAGYRYAKEFERGITRLRWDSRFRYAESPDELEVRPPAGSVGGLVHWLHGLFHGECQTVDRMGWLLVDFADLPWAMRKDMAQQAWEEARHIQIVAQLIEGMGGRLGQHPFPPYFAHLRRDHHHPLAHMVMGNLMGEGSAAAQTNDALSYTADWSNDWLRRGLEHLAADEVVHVNFGKIWGRRLSLADRVGNWEQGKAHALAAAAAIQEAQRAFGLVVDPTKQTDRIEREFAALARERAAPADATDGQASEY